MKSEPAILKFPLRGAWKALKSPGHHRFAYDFAALGNQHQRIFTKSIGTLLLGKATVEDAFSWSKPVYSPVSGRVVRVNNDQPDQQSLNFFRDFTKIFSTSIFASPHKHERLLAFAGNHMIIKSGNLFAFIAHLQRGSIRARKGDEIKRGKWIGRVGNSGTTLGPHLHFQVMDGKEPFEASIVPFKFKSYERWNGTEWNKVERQAPEKGESIRFKSED